jgi:hypothetical protein
MISKPKNFLEALQCGHLSEMVGYHSHHPLVSVLANTASCLKAMRKRLPQGSIALKPMLFFSSSARA